MKLLLPILFLVVLGGCAATVRTADPDLPATIESRTPPPDLTLTIPGLGPCDDNSPRTLYLNSREPVIILVHGCLGSAGNFRALAEVFAFSGQQAVCFSYNDRDSLMASSAQLTTAIETLAESLQRKKITVIGHSQGGLIARKALIADRPEPFNSIDAGLELVTVSAPFSGITAASHCGSTLARVLSLGLTVPICKLVSGDKWHEITASSDFIRNPGGFVPQVAAHLKINTDETDSCRRVVGDNCAESDYVFSLEEQRYQPVDADAAVQSFDVKAGHVEIVGDQHVVPHKLIAILQQQGILNIAPAERSAAFRRLLTRLY